MKGLFRIAVGVSLCLVAPALCTEAFAQSKTYTNDMYGYAIQYPSDYEFKPIGGIITFASKKTDKKFQFAHNVNILVSFLGNDPPSLDDFFEKSKARLKQHLPNADVIDEKTGRVAGHASRRLVYTTRQKEATFKIMQEMFIYKDRVFILTFTDLAEGYNAHLAQAEKLIRSFKVFN